MTLGSVFWKGLLPLYVFPLIVMVLKKPCADTPEPAAQSTTTKSEREEDARMMVSWRRENEADGVGGQCSPYMRMLGFVYMP
jgi:hypothetical protein